MATDATGAPTPLGIPKFNTSADAPSGLGSNAQMDSIDALLAARVVKPTGIASGEAAVWNGTGWDRSSTTKITANGLTGLGSLVTGVVVSGANTDLAWSGGSAAVITYDVGTVGGTLRSVAASSQGAGSRLVIRNGAGSAFTILHNTAGGTGLPLYIRDVANLSLAVGEVVEFVQSGTLWIEVNRDRATGVGPTHLWGAAIANHSFTLTANQAYLIPIPDVVAVATLSRLAFYVDTQSGNMDVGIYYSDDETTFTRLFAQGSFATPAAGLTLKAITAQTITPATARRWYYGIALDNATAALKGSNPGVANSFVPGGYFKATSFPLPASLTGMTAITTQPTPTVHGLV